MTVTCCFEWIQQERMIKDGRRKTETWIEHMESYGTFLHFRRILVIAEGWEKGVKKG